MSRRSVCDQCGDPMESRRSTRHFCSTRCRVRAARVALSVTTPTDTAPTVSAAPARPVPAPAPHLPRPVEVRHVPGERMTNGYPSGIGGRTTYVVDGRSFDTPRAALDWASR